MNNLKVGQYIWTSWGCDVRQSTPYKLRVTDVPKKGEKFYAKFCGRKSDPYPHGCEALLYKSNFEPAPKENANVDTLFTFKTLESMEQFIKNCMLLDIKRKQKIVDTFKVKRPK